MALRKDKFQKTVWQFYASHKRGLPWRSTRDPYKILISEVMLQQTQSSRVLPKYKSWIKRFPTFDSVSKAALKEVLEEWSGLGYNRRALNLKRTCEIIARDFKGEVPKAYEELVKLPGIGPYTARAIRAFAWNEPEIFIETNIRSVFIHHFFPERKRVHDRDLLPLIKKTLDTQNPREWYWALMDYGSFLKRAGNPSRSSAHYTRQSTFKGSNRQERSEILKVIQLLGSATEMQVKSALTTKGTAPKNLKQNLTTLTKEGFLEKKQGRFSIRD